MTTPEGKPSQGVSGGSAGSAVEDARRQAAAGESRVVNTDQDRALDAASDVAAQGKWKNASDVNDPAAGPVFGR